MGDAKGLSERHLNRRFCLARWMRLTNAARARLLRFAPGVFTAAPFVHEYWEEVYLVSGDLTVGSNANGNGGKSFPPNTYACRPPGAHHGPFKSNGGCTLLEMHYFDPV